MEESGIVNQTQINSENISKKLKFNKNKVHSKKAKENEIFISKKRSYKSKDSKSLEKFYYQRAHSLIFDKHFKELFVCGLGACLNLAVKTALTLTQCIPSLYVENVTTETVTHVDDYLDEETKLLEMRTEDRKSNLIRIKLIKK